MVTHGRSDERAFLHFDALEEQMRAKDRRDEGAEAVERLAEGQAEVAVLRVAKRRDQRVGGDLQDGDPAGQHEQADQDQREDRRGWPRQMISAADDHGDQRGDDRGHGPGARQQRRRREGDQRRKR